MNAETIRFGLRALLVLLVGTWGTAWLQKGAFIDSGEAHPLLREKPIQVDVERETFEFVYKEKVCRVRPVAEYDLRGLVVSHNDIESFADMVHDSTSVDTKDLCVIWGPNLERDDFHRVDFRSGQFTCYFSYPSGVEFNHWALSNNHLITDSDVIREAIAAVRVGDQVRLTGMLVDYQMEDWGSFWRRTSTTRKGANCEVLFVETLEVLKQGTPGWYAAHAWAGRGLVVTILLYAGFVWWEVTPRRSGST